MTPFQNPKNQIPIGTVTFVFTDIVGSTRMWEENPTQMNSAIARHDAIMQEVAEYHGGYVFKTVGDAFCIAFHTPVNALNFCIESLDILQKELWPEPIQIKVRMAIHSGSAELRDGDYFGQALNRIARLVNCGHGGQILMSSAAQELVRDNMPDGISIRDLGEKRLKDLVRPERIFQVLRLDLEDQFPPLATLDLRDNNLPVHLTSFIGREKEMGEIEALVKSGRLVSILGPGGAGKSRIAIQVAAEMIDQFENGVWFIELGSLSDAENVVPAIAQTLKIREQHGRSILATLIESIADKNLMLVLDNCEHLIDACASLVESIATSNSSTKIVATSREALGIPGEQSYRLPSLSLPPTRNPNNSPIIESFSMYESVRLFVDRAILSNSDFSITNDNAQAVANICVQLDGIPLAIELAAARIRTLSAEEIYARLHDRFQLLTTGSRTAIPRQKTLRALIDWSYDLLSESERCLLRQLSVFVNGWTLDTAERAFKVEDGNEDILDLLSSLVNKSLVVSWTIGSSTRYHLIQSIRYYGIERLVENDEVRECKFAHQRVFADLSIQAKAELKGPNQSVWLDRLEDEHDNFRAVLQFCFDEGDNQEIGLQICSSLYIFWWIRGHWTEGRSWHERLLSISQTQGNSSARALALISAGHLALYQGEYANAKAYYRESLEIHNGLEGQDEIAISLHNLAHASHLEGDLLTAKPLYEKSLQIRRDQKNQQGITSSLNNLANIAQELGNYDEARLMHEENLAIRRSLGVAQGIGQTLQNLGCLAIATEDYSRAVKLFEEALVCIEVLKEIRSVSEILDGLAEIASKIAKLDVAVRLWGSAETIRNSLGAPLHDLDRHRQQAAYDEVRAELGDQTFEKAWEMGANMDSKEACAFALSELP
jgi:predicted ATPase/class 3 adenylate cyclase